MNKSQTRIKILGDYLYKQHKEHLGWFLLIMINLLIPIGIELYYALVHHDWFYGKPLPFILFIIINGLYILLLRKIARFVVRFIFADSYTTNELY